MKNSNDYRRFPPAPQAKSYAGGKNTLPPASTQILQTFEMKEK